jgi:hypothetical protein
MQLSDQPPDGPLSLSVPQHLPPPPRRARRRRGRPLPLLRVPLWLRLLGTLGLGLLLVALWFGFGSLAVTLLGTKVPGEITGKVVTRDRGSAEARVTFTYFVGEQEHTAEVPVSEEAAAQLYVSKKIKARVLRWWPGNPRLVEPVSQSAGTAVYLWWLVVPWLAAVGVVFWLYERRYRRQRRLVHQGRETSGKILGKETVGGRSPTGLVHFSYWAPRDGTRPAAGDAVVPHREWEVLMPVRARDFETAQVGTAVTVLYDPHKPSRSMIYAFADYEATAT